MHLCIYQKWSKSWGFCVKMDMCTFAHEHPGTRGCTIHPCTLTPTLTNNTTNHCISVHMWISLATVCFVFCHGRADFERISCRERAPKRRSCRLKRRSFLQERRRPTRLHRCPGRSTRRWKVVIRTLELLGEIREFLEDFSENGVKSLQVVSYLQSLRRRDAGEVGAWIWKAHFEHVTCFSDEKIFRIDAVAPGRSFHTFYRGKWPDVTTQPSLFGIHHAKRGGRGVTSAHFLATFHDTSLRGRVYLSMDTHRRGVAWALSPDVSPNDCFL